MERRAKIAPVDPRTSSASSTHEPAGTMGRPGPPRARARRRAHTCAMPAHTHVCPPRRGPRAGGDALSIAGAADAGTIVYVLSLSG